MTAVSLFAGCGGFDAGFHDAGFKTLFAADHDKTAVETYNQNLDCVAEVRDLTGGLGTEISKLRPTCVIAGPPCQGFSTVGKRNPDDPRSHLLPTAGKLALEFKPSVIVIENVPGVKVGEPSRHWNELIELLRSANYKTNDILCDGQKVGLAQRRRRIFLFAWNTDRDFPCLPIAKDAGRLDVTLAGVEKLSDHNPQPLEIGSRLYRIAQRIGPGQKLCNVRGGVRSVHTWHIPEVFGATTAAECRLLETLMRLRRSERMRDVGDADPVQLKRLLQECGQAATKLVKSLQAKGYIVDKGDGLDLAQTFNGKFRRFRWDDVAATVDTRFGDPHLFLHPNEHRPFTVREAARIQGFPDHFTFKSQVQKSFRLVGNAVPPPMAHFAATIVKHLAS